MKDEIDLGKIILDLWEGKWKIISSTFIAFIIGFGFTLTTPQRNYHAITDIKPLNSTQAQEYYQLNSLDFFKITSENLLNLYNEQLDSKLIFLDVIKDLKIYKKSDFKTEKDFDNSIIRLASRIEILFPNNNDKDKDNNINDFKKNKHIRKYHQIVFTHTDQELWKNILTEFHKINQEFVRKELIKRFNQKISIVNQKKTFNLEDIQILKDNVKADFDKQIEKFQLEQSFKTEDIKVSKENAYEDYDKKISNRLAFLNEQKKIARKLEVAKNTIETQIFNTKNGALVNFKTDTPFYLRGYEAIEKEIELINDRDEKSLFINDLLELEKRERALEQDKTLERAELNKMYIDSLLELEKKERSLKQDKTLERVDIYFKSSPLMNEENFVAVNLDIAETKFKYSNNQNYKILFFAIFLGLSIGSFYVLISNALKNRKK